MGLLISIDNGGTLTDFCVVSDDRVFHTKTLTTPFDLSKCFFEGLTKVSGTVYGNEDVGKLLSDADHIRYSTTVGTNALVERKGSKLGLLVTTGTDTGKLNGSAHLTSLFGDLIDDRVRTVSLDDNNEDFEREVIKAVNELVTDGASRMVIAADSADFTADEARIKSVIRRKFPSHLLGAIPLLSAGELTDDPVFERRAWTGILNSFLHPAMERFLYSADHRLKSLNVVNPLLVFRNDGGSARVAKTTAVKTYSSGPRGGMEGVRAVAEHFGYKKMVSYDVGGTTTDIGVVENGRIRTERRGRCEGVHVSFPLADLVSAGVGGSSIIKAEDGKIKVGPESVGAAPGPACFGRGGKQATITDVFLLQGVFDKASFFGGGLALDEERAKTAVMTNVAEPMGWDLDKALLEMEQAWVNKIAGAIKDFAGSCEDAVLAGFGGAGALAATAIADAVGAKKILIPKLAAVFSAYGINFSEISQEYSLVLHDLTVDGLHRIYTHLIERARRDMFAEGAKLADCEVKAVLVRERGDDIEEFAIDRESSTLPCDLKDSDQVTVEMLVTKPVRRARFEDYPTTDQQAEASAQRNFLGGDGQRTDVPVYPVAKLTAGAYGQGPAIIEEDYFTGKIAAGWSFKVTPTEDILLTRDK